MTDNQCLERRGEMRRLLTDEYLGLKNDYAIVRTNHGGSTKAIAFLYELEGKIKAIGELLSFYKK